MTELPCVWTELKLEDIALRRGGSLTPSDYPDEEFELYSVPSFSDGHPEIKFGKEIKSSKQIVHPGDVLLCKIVPHINRVWTVGARGRRRQIASGEWIIYRDHQCEPEYLRLLLSEKSFRSRFLSTVSGVGGSLMRANPKAVSEFEVPLAPIGEQRRIVSKIGSLFGKSKRARDHLDHVPRLVEKYKEAVLSAAFRGRLTSNWRATKVPTATGAQLLSAARGAHQCLWEQEELDRFRQKGTLPKSDAWKTAYVPFEPIDTSDELFDLPATWAWATAEEIVEPGSDIVYGIVQPGPKLQNGVPYVRGTDIENGKIKIDQLLFTSEEIAQRYARASLKGGDILLGIIRATKVAIVPEVLNGANITQGTARFRPSAQITTSFLARWLESPDAQNWLHSKYRGIDMPGLNLRDVRRCPIPLAPLKEQEVITAQIETAFAWIDRLASEATSARKLVDHLDQAILSKAFRGGLVPQDPNDEPASVLLDRIRADGASDGHKGRKRSRASA